MNYKLIKKSLYLIIFAELFSLFSFYFSALNNVIFVIVALFALVLTIIKLEYGVWVLLVELFIGSMGHLFIFQIDDYILPIRIALWIIIMSVWASKATLSWIKNKKLEIIFLKSSYFSYFSILFLFLIWGLINGYLNNNISNLFFDFNGWLYFALVFPIYDAIKDKKSINNILQVLGVAILWVFIKTLILLFFFSHSSPFLMKEIYTWVRDTKVGEITLIQGGFYRIFIQSQIYSLVGFFVLVSCYILKVGNEIKINKQSLKYLLGLIMLNAVIIVSLSRSFWVGFIFGIFILSAYLIWKKYKILNLLKIYLLIFLSIIFSVLLIVVVAKFPYPSPSGDFSASALLSERASSFTGEAAASSRWSLLPAVWDEIKDTPILGKGFGATVTYISSDPRILESSPTGEFTTYAFEWGWLDVWLKLGLLGLLTYVILIGKIIFDGIKSKNSIVVGLSIGLAIISVVSIFSPYLNHPLGIGYLILVSVIIFLEKKKAHL